MCSLHKMVSRYFLLLILSVSASSLALKLVDPLKTGLVFYYGPTYEHSQYYSLSEVLHLPDHPKFIYERTHIFIHGFAENQKNESLLIIVDAYLSSGRPINLVTVDYGKLVSADYVSAIANMIRLAPLLADKFLKLFTHKLDGASVTVVGHSLGAQLAGYIGREMRRKSNKKSSLEVIWGLDPAFPGFLPQKRLPALKTLGKDDANFVAIIHTNAPNYNLPLPLGHVDFYPNGGLQGQPGCPKGILIPFSKEDLCSHQISWRLWAESIKHLDEPKLTAFPAPNYIKFLLKGPDMNKAIVMGPECPLTARGKYYLFTNSGPRYAKGLNYKRIDLQ